LEINDLVYQSAIIIIGLTAVCASLGVILCSSPIYSALYLIGNMVCLAMLYLLYHAEFIAVVQIIVYAGAVMILFLFIIALLGGKKELQEHSLQRTIAFGFAGLLFGELLLAATVGVTKPIEGIFDPINLKVIGGAKAIGLTLYSKHLIPFELASILLLVATIGVICLAKFPLKQIKKSLNS
jgi:NADH-quinone oxidoreductase subunit J